MWVKVGGGNKLVGGMKAKSRSCKFGNFEDNGVKEMWQRLTKRENEGSEEAENGRG